jgi:propanol-preferring alcohol dehydrogenase
VEQVGAGATAIQRGDRVGVAWLHHTCGKCKYCLAGKENLCEAADFTGYTVDGGYAQYVVAPAGFVYRIPDGFSDLQAAPLLCAGIIGYRALKLSGIQAGGRLGLYGFGAAAHVAVQVARYWKVDVFACTRDEKHRRLALELGAVWAGDTYDQPPFPLDAAIIFAPAGEIVPAALRALDKGGVLVLGGIHMSPIPSLDYELLYHERVIRSVANNTREDGREFLDIAARIPVETHTETFPLRDANRALNALKNDAIRGAAVLMT